MRIGMVVVVIWLIRSDRRRPAALFRLGHDELRQVELGRGHSPRRPAELHRGQPEGVVPHAWQVI
jgi:hypothetical protein